MRALLSLAVAIAVVPSIASCADDEAVPDGRPADERIDAARADAAVALDAAPDAAPFCGYQTNNVPWPVCPEYITECTGAPNQPFDCDYYCYLGGCCSMSLGSWTRTVIDCVPPPPPPWPDAGVDAQRP